MGRPKLKMCKEDVESVMASTFKRQVGNLKFSGGQKFSCVDSDGECRLSIQEGFKGKGTYPFSGRVKLRTEYDGFYSDLLYNVSGNIMIEESKDGEPTARFDGVISARKA